MHKCVCKLKITKKQDDKATFFIAISMNMLLNV